MPTWVYPPQESPRRRALNAALGGLGQGLQAIGTFGLQSSLQRDLLAQRTNAANQEHLRTLMMHYGDLVTKGDLEPEQAAAASGLPVGYFASLAPSSGKVTAGLMDAIGKAPQLEQVPSDKQLLGSMPQRMKVMGIRGRVSPSAPDTGSAMQVPMQNSDTGETIQPTEGTRLPTLASRQFQPEALDPNLKAILDAAAQKRGSFTTKVEGVVGSNGVKQDQYVPTSSVQGQSFPTERTPTQEGERVGQSAVAGLRAEIAGGMPQMKGAAAVTEAMAGPDANPTFAAIKAEIANMTERLTRGEKVGTAAAQAGATRQASLNVENNPANVAASASREAAMTKAREAVETPTEGESRAANALTQLLPTHAKLTEMENRGIGIPLRSQIAGKVPIVGGAIANRLMGADQQQYVQAGSFFTDLYGFARSGVTVRPDERDNFLRSILAQPADTPENIKAKQLTRQAFISATELQARRGQRAAGAAFGNAIKQGLIPPQLLNTLKFTSGDFLTGIGDVWGADFVNHLGQGLGGQ